MIFAQYNYRNYHNDNKELHPLQPYSHYNWLKMVNDNYNYCHKMNLIKWIKFYYYIFIIKRYSIVDLPSFHEYWKIQTQKDMKIQIIDLKNKLEECKKDNTKLKYLFNSTTSLKMIEDKINDLEIKNGYNITRYSTVGRNNS